MIAPKLRDFLRDKVNSFVKWDLVRFFHDNPHARDTAESIAETIGRDAGVVSPALDALVEAGLLDVEAIHEVQVYTLASDPQARALIADFMQACEDREFRKEAIHQVIAGMPESSGLRSHG